MTAKRKRFALPRLLGVILFLVAISSATSGWIFRLDYVKDQSGSLQDEVGIKQLDVVRGRAIADGSEVEANLAGRFHEWKQMVDDETLRVEALSVAAQS